MKPKGTKIKKRTKRFIRQQSNVFKRVKPNWRRPKGIDNKTRKKVKGCVKLPSVGYGTEKVFKHREADNLIRVTISCKKELEAIANQKENYKAEFSHTLSSRKRLALKEVADNYGIKVVNALSKVEKVEA